MCIYMCKYTNKSAFMHIAGKVKVVVGPLSMNMGRVKTFESLLPWTFFPLNYSSTKLVE